MIKRFFIYSFLFLPMLFSCKGGFTTSSNGLKYKIYHLGSGKPGRLNDIVVFRLMLKSGDSTFVNTFKNSDSIKQQIQKPMYHGDPSELFTMVGKGDSAVAMISADSFYKEKCPPFLKGKTITMYIKIRDTYDEEAYKTANGIKLAKEQKLAQETQDKEEQVLADYIKTNDPKAIKTESGAYYSVMKPGSGPKFKEGDVIWAHYTGRLMNGKEFDSDKGKEPLKFYYGQNKLIKGFSEGLNPLKKGAKAKIYVPSRLAYGKRSSATVPAYSTLVFDVEIIDVK